MGRISPRQRQRPRSSLISKARNRGIGSRRKRTVRRDWKRYPRGYFDKYKKKPKTITSEGSAKSKKIKPRKFSYAAYKAKKYAKNKVAIAARKRGKPGAY